MAKYEPTKEELKNGWDAESLDAYVAERAAAARQNIFGNLGNWDERTNRPRRTLKIERGSGVHGWARGGFNPHDWARDGHDPRDKHLSPRGPWGKRPNSVFD